MSWDMIVHETAIITQEL